MSNKKETSHVLQRIWPIELLIGVILLAVVFVIATKADIARTEEEIYDNVDYIKEQCDIYNRLNLAAETRSLMRVIESSKQVAQRIQYEKELNGTTLPDEEDLKVYAQDNFVTGILVLDESGKVKVRYCTDDLAEEGFTEELENETLLEVATFKEKNYSTRVYCEDGSYIDLAACARLDQTGVIVTYYHTPIEYAENFNLSFATLLSGYSIEKDGRIVITSGDQIIASNDEAMIGKSVDAIPVLHRIKESKGNGKLLHARESADGFSRDFGMIERGRNFYVYAYLPERAVFTTTPRNLTYTLVVYVFALAILNMVRWRTAQTYQKEQMKMQEEYAITLQSKNAQLESAVRRETKANAAKTNFLSRMTHDIRTPLNGIIGLLKIDEAHPDDQELIKANREKMLISANHLLSLINDMLQMSKLEGNEVVLAHDWMDLNQLSKDVLTIVGQRAADAGVTMVHNRNPEQVVYPYVYGSPLHVRQLFLNIYGNCIKYNKVGGQVETQLEYCGVQDGIVTYRWTIQDTGVGMSEEFLQHIFEPFAQEHVDAKSVYNGTGLGMAIVKRLIDKMNGTIEIKSKEGEGSTFIITLPFEVAEEKEHKPEKKTEGRRSIKGLHLLLAEDNQLNAEIAQMLFEDEGAEITIAGNGQEAIDQFVNHPAGTYDAILMDIMMPLVDGYSATKAIRSMKRKDAKEIPIIAMTANAFDEDAKQCLEAGMNAHLSKPLQMEIVVETIAKYCGEK